MNQLKLREYYEDLFAQYPDVVDLPTFRKMMGGMSESFARKILRNKTVKSFKIPAMRHDAYRIPKDYVLDYVTSDEYQGYKHNLKHSV